MSPSPVSRRIRQMPESPTLAVTARAKALKAAGEAVIGFGAGEPDFPTSEHVVEAAAAAAAEPGNHRYSPAAGQPGLREAVADKTARDSGYEVGPSQVVITNGAKQALYNVFQALLDPGDEVIVPAPYWVSYPEQVRLAEGEPVTVATTAETGFRVTVEQLEEVRTERTKALVYVSPSNPTGAVYPRDEAEAVARWALENGVWIVTDEIYEHLVYGGAEAPSLPVLVPELADQSVVVNGVSKTYAMTGWRVGWSISPVELAQAMGKLQSQTTSNVCNVAQAAAHAALTGPQDAVARMREAFDRRRRTAVEGLRALPGVDCYEPQGAFYVYPSFHGVLGTRIAGQQVDDTVALASVLLDEAKVAVVPGEAFGTGGYVRVSYALSDADLTDGIARIGKLLA